MPVEVDFVTMKIAKDHIKRPEATVRLWVDQLEKFEVHYFMRNDAGERIFYENDLEILVYVNKLKKEYGRSVRMENLAHMVYEEGQKGNLKLRRSEDAPRPEPTNQHLKLLNHEDIEQLMASDRVRQFMKYVVDNTRAEIADDFRELLEERDEEILRLQEKLLEQQQEENKKTREKMDKLEEALRKREEASTKQMVELEESLRQREEASTKQMTELKKQMQKQDERQAEREVERQAEKDNQSKGWFARLLGK